MEKPSMDRDSLIFSQARRLERGIEFVAEFQADKVSNPKEGRRYYCVTLTIDPTIRCPRNDGRWELTKDRIYSGPKDKLRVLEYQLCDEFTKTIAWDVLSERTSDPNLIVDELGNIVDPPPPIHGRF